MAYFSQYKIVKEYDANRQEHFYVAYMLRKKRYIYLDDNSSLDTLVKDLSINHHGNEKLTIDFELKSVL